MACSGWSGHRAGSTSFLADETAEPGGLVRKVVVVDDDGVGLPAFVEMPGFREILDLHDAVAVLPETGNQRANSIRPFAHDEDVFSGDSPCLSLSSLEQPDIGFHDLGRSQEGSSCACRPDLILASTSSGDPFDRAEHGMPMPDQGQDLDREGEVRISRAARFAGSSPCEQR